MSTPCFALEKACANRPDPGLCSKVREELGENVDRCWQCVKCTSGCPLAEAFDVPPHEVMRSLQFGDARVLSTRAIWLCASCQTCATRCPRGIDVTSVMALLRREALERGVAPAIPDIPRFNAIYLRLARWFGRIPEALLVAAFNLARGTPFRDAKLGWQLLRRGRLPLLPRIARKRRVAPAGEASGKVAYFPGCAGEGTAADYDRSARMAARHLGIELVEPPGWKCCGANAAASQDAAEAERMPMRTLRIVERMQLDTLASPCSSCFSRLKKAEVEDRNEARPVKVEHLLDTLFERAGPEKIAAKVERPLAGLKVACYYGCLITRPSRVTGAEHPEYPVKMDRIIRALGAEPVSWSSKTDCCGGSLGITRTETAVKLTGRVIANARASGADLVATMCPLCHLNLDARQGRLDGAPLPVVHATQLMLLAFGCGEREAMLDRSIVDSRPLLAAKGLLG